MKCVENVGVGVCLGLPNKQSDVLRLKKIAFGRNDVALNLRYNVRLRRDPKYKDPGHPAHGCARSLGCVSIRNAERRILLRAIPGAPTSGAVILYYIT